ncbi:unnamed protein product [Dovyalis caffra]|uniref:PGG domain-containing protein n=1 Tax=Dovyalis caffra TaxID=77055 RepID=A0AAV1SEX1_9ROSI|nr:unnamed protein product [Dovyalis caffra]
MGHLAINIGGDHRRQMNYELFEAAKRDDEVNTFLQLPPSRSPPAISDQVTPSGNSILHVAASYGSKNVSEYLAREFPALITKLNSINDTPLHLAARAGKLTTTETLVRFGPGLLKVKNREGNTPLHDAVIRSHCAVARSLVSADHDVAYLKNKAGKSPLYLAVENIGYKKAEKSPSDENNHDKDVILDLLLDSIAKDTDSLNLLRRIAEKKPELLHFLDKELGNPLHFASYLGNLKVVQFLLKEKELSAVESNQEGDLPIHVACKSGHVEVVEELLEQWPDPMEFLNQKRQNILHVAAENGQSKLVQYILQNPGLDLYQKGLLLNGIDEEGNTPLHLAAKHGHPWIVFILVINKALDKNIVNNENLTFYDIADNQLKSLVEEQTQKPDVQKVAVQDCKDTETAVDSAKRSTNNYLMLPDEDDLEKQHEKAYPIRTQVRKYINVMAALSILYFYADPKKSLDKYSTSMEPKRQIQEETRSRMNNLLVIAVLVAGVAFAGAVQSPQICGSADGHRHSKCSSSSFIFSLYLYSDVWALNTSLVAAILISATQLVYIQISPLAVWISSTLVGVSIYFMSLAFLFAVIIALANLEYAWLAFLTAVLAISFIAIQRVVGIATLLYAVWLIRVWQREMGDFPFFDDDDDFPPCTKRRKINNGEQQDQFDGGGSHGACTNLGTV